MGGPPAGMATGGARVVRSWRDLAIPSLERRGRHRRATQHVTFVVLLESVGEGVTIVRMFLCGGFGRAGGHGCVERREIYPTLYRSCA